jgi:SAM-dependent methyltransferase
MSTESTRSSYDLIAADYAGQFAEELADNHWDRMALTAFAGLVGGGRVADIGCGPGRVTRFLTDLGLDAFGVDLSPGMIAEARKRHPELRFEIGDMTDLDLPDDTLDGICAWYSTIHVPDELLPRALREFHRVLKPGGHAILAFQAGDEIVERAELFGQRVSLKAVRRQPESVAGLLGDAALPVRATIVREPEAFPSHVEKTRQAYLIARKR